MRKGRGHWVDQSIEPGDLVGYAVYHFSFHDVLFIILVFIKALQPGLKVCRTLGSTARFTTCAFLIT